MTWCLPSPSPPRPSISPPIFKVLPLEPTPAQSFAGLYQSPGASGIQGRGPACLPGKYLTGIKAPTLGYGGMVTDPALESCSCWDAKWRRPSLLWGCLSARSNSLADEQALGCAEGSGVCNLSGLLCSGLPPAACLVLLPVFSQLCGRAGNALGIQSGDVGTLVVGIRCQEEEFMGSSDHACSHRGAADGR